MCDVVETAKSGLPSIAFVTVKFWDEAEFVAASNGMPAVPRVGLPHPVAGTGPRNIRTVAEKAASEVLDVLRGPS